MSVVVAPAADRKRAALALPGLGLTVLDPPFGRRGRLTARLLAAVPWRLREALLHNDTRLCMPAQKALQRLLGGRHMVSVRFTVGRLAGRTFDCLTSEKYFLMGARYEDAVQQRLADCIRPGDVVYDVGAHAGYWALLFAGAAGAGGRVFAFEPSPLAFGRLVRNVRTNGVRVVPVNAGACDVEGEAFLTERGTQSRVVEHRPAGAASRVRLVRLDDFVHRDHRIAPTFVKIDVEGDAGPCLAGLDRVLGETRPRLLVEVHDPAELAAVNAAVVRRGYAVSPVERTRRFPRHVYAEPAP